MTFHQIVLEMVHGVTPLAKNVQFCNLRATYLHDEVRNMCMLLFQDYIVINLYQITA